MRISWVQCRDSLAHKNALFSSDSDTLGKDFLRREELMDCT